MVILPGVTSAMAKLPSSFVVSVHAKEPVSVRFTPASGSPVAAAVMTPLMLPDPRPNPRDASPQCGSGRGGFDQRQTGRLEQLVDGQLAFRQSLLM